MRIEMPEDAEWIIGKLRERGFEAFAVGGCVRDAVLGREPEDWDITTSAKPEDVKAVFQKTVDTGIAHGTVTVIRNGKGYEVTTYRIDGEYRDHRHPERVEFTSDLREDLRRRDFTINAMAYSHETGIVDEFGGMDDLKAGLVRCVGNPAERFTEDALRILRAVRFLAQLDFSIDRETLAAMEALAPNLAHVSRERIQAEFTKLLLSGCPERMELVREAGISRYAAEGFDEVFAGAERARGERSPEWLLKLRLLPPEKSFRWAGFLRYGAAGEAKKVLRGLKLDNETIENARAMVQIYHEPLRADKTELRMALSRVTEKQFDGALRLRELDEPESDAGAGAVRRLWGEIRESGDCIRLKDLAVDGGDLIRAGMKPGKELGAALNDLFLMVLKHPEWNEKEILLDKLKQR